MPRPLSVALFAVLFAGCAEGTLRGEGPAGGRADSGAAGADDTAAAPPGPLHDDVDIDPLLAHLDALDAIGAAHGGNRLALSPGYDASVAYVVGVLEDAGYTVTRQEFPWSAWQRTGPAALDAVGQDWADNADIAPFSGSAGGSVTAEVVPVAITLPMTGPANTSDSGCSARHWEGFPVGAIALVQRGTCTFTDKVVGAQAAGASAVILFNEGQSDRRDLLQGNMEPSTIPVLGARTAVAEAIVAALAGGPVTATLTVAAETTVGSSWNILADLPGERPEMVVVGAHLDSVAAGPGVNDNGSGTAFVLEAARLLAARGEVPANTLRFAFWGAEEAGLIGSSVYVQALGPADRAAHLANLNFDMLASPNGARFVYDGDGDSGLPGFPAPVGSALIESFFTDFFATQGQSWLPTAFDGRSDYGPFIAAGIPAGGLFSGAEQAKTALQARDFGGEAGEAYDACYHRGCDARPNVDPVLFLDLARAAAASIEAAASTPAFVDPPSRSRGPRGPVLTADPGRGPATCGGPGPLLR